MKIIDAAAVAACLTPLGLVEALAEGFRAAIETPVRHHHTIDRGTDEPAATLLLMPAWHGAADGGYIGIKVVSVFPGNAARNLSTITGSYLLLSGRTGVPLAMIDGRELTLWRTAAASALASRHLSRPDSRRLLMVGSGALAPFLITAHAAVRPIETVEVWNRNPVKAVEIAGRLTARLGRTVTAAMDLPAALGRADIVSAATLSSQPLVTGADLAPGTHVDLVGGFTPAMREADDEAIRRAEVYVDTRAGATHEAGDIVQPLRSGVLAADGIRGDLFDLCRGIVPGRGSREAITLFKSVGTALEDLAAAALVYESVHRSG